MKLFALVIVGLLAGCSTQPAAIQAMAEAQAKMAQVRTLEAECTGPCKINFTDPRDRQTVRMPTNGWDAMASITGSVERIVTGAVLPAATVAIVREVRRAGEGGNTSNTTTTTNTASGDGSATGGSGAYHTEQIGPDSNNTTTTSGDTTTTTDSHDATATPTVVNQPPPIVVRPEVVNPVIWTPIP
jgi:hypothetical protein